jgi:hypothetical protein
MSFLDEAIGPLERSSEMRDSYIEFDQPRAEIGKNLGVRRE